LPLSRKKKRTHKTNHLTSILLVLPLLLFYEVGVLFADVMNGADFLTGALLRLTGLKGFLVIQAVMLLLAIGLAFYLRRSQRFEMRHFIPVLLESGVYALTMGTLILFVMTDLLGIDPRLAAGAAKQIGLFDKLVLSVGAGVFEELVFRLVLLGGLSWLGTHALKLRGWVSLLIAFGISSVLFSLAHHIGPMGEPLRVGVFTYRVMAGLFFGALFQFRGFPIAVWTHALYDIYVMLLR
jgi:membrane protease YdiL (CAAX protease family)